MRNITVMVFEGSVDDRAFFEEQVPSKKYSYDLITNEELLDASKGQQLYVLDKTETVIPSVFKGSPINRKMTKKETEEYMRHFIEDGFGHVGRYDEDFNEHAWATTQEFDRTLRKKVKHGVNVRYIIVPTRSKIGKGKDLNLDKVLYGNLIEKYKPNVVFNTVSDYKQSGAKVLDELAKEHKVLVVHALGNKGRKANYGFGESLVASSSNKDYESNYTKPGTKGVFEVDELKHGERHGTSFVAPQVLASITAALLNNNLEGVTDSKFQSYMYSALYAGLGKFKQGKRENERLVEEDSLDGIYNYFSDFFKKNLDFLDKNSKMREDEVVNKDALYDVNIDLTLGVK